MNRSIGLVVFLAVVASPSLEGARRPKLQPMASATAATTANHPLDPLTAPEYQRSYEAVRNHFTASAALPDAPLLFPYVALDEPPKSAVLLGGAPLLPRRATVHVMHPPSNRTWIATVELSGGAVTNLEVVSSGQPAITAEEFAIADALVHEYEPWQQAMRVRGVDPEQVYVDVWAPGDQELPPAVVAQMSFGADTRIVRAIAFHRGASIEEFDPERPQNPYARPIEGVVVTIDLNERRVVHMTDSLNRPVSRDSGNAETVRSGLQPIRVTQPNGAGFEIQGRIVRWQNWQFHVALHPREGVVFHDVRYKDGDILRPVAYRMSLSEIYVPYGVADPNWSWRTAFDVGEYNLGSYAQTLEPNRDIPEHAYVFDAVLGSDTGPDEANPSGTWDYPATIALYERDRGILWTRTDPSNAERDTRGRRDLVVTWNAWIGNYIYGFDWIFGMDGSIEVEVALTGATLNRGVPDGAYDEEEALMAPIVGIDDHGVRVAAPNHQHFFSFRLDLDVDGVENAVRETSIVPLAVPGSKNAFGPHEALLATEGFRDADPFSTRHWEISSGTTHNAVGGHTSFALETAAIARPLSQPDYEPLLRAAFAQHTFWVTRYAEGEDYAAGDFPNQGHGPAGLPSFITPPQSLGDHTGADIVIWPTIGMTHVPRPEDYPVMPTETIGFRLVPHGFFDRNPALDAQELPTVRRRTRPIR